MLLIESKNFMTSSNLVYDESGYKWVTDTPALAISTDDSPTSLNQIAEIFGEDIDPLIPDFYINSAKVLSTDPPWCFYIGKQKFLSMVDLYCEKHNNFFKNNDRLKIEMHVKISKFLEKLKPAKYSLSTINTQDLDRHIQSHITPNLKDGYLKTPVYSRTGTKTGRLKVVSGPNVLTMQSDLRKGLVDGYSIDFISMEPNLLLALQGQQPKVDIYETIRKDLFKDEISRTKVKIATMASLYGSGREDKIAKTISDYFGCEKMVSELESRVAYDTIKNEYGRVLKLGGARGRHLLSLWLQSSAADAAIYGFNNFNNQNDIIPHWIIHDGLIFIYKQGPKTVKELDIGLGIKLPVKVEKL
jgi:hypothetical protein